MVNEKEENNKLEIENSMKGCQVFQIFHFNLLSMLLSTVLIES